MEKIPPLDEHFKKFIEQIKDWPAELVIEVNLSLLHELDLMHYKTNIQQDPRLTRYFHVVETKEKITLINDDFIVWIVPDKQSVSSLTYTLIAINEGGTPRLELAFINCGVYNTSRLVLRVLERILFDIEENENFLKNLK